jgi:hypothetical protein
MLLRIVYVIWNILLDKFGLKNVKNASIKLTSINRKIIVTVLNACIISLPMFASIFHLFKMKEVLNEPEGDPGYTFYKDQIKNGNVTHFSSKSNDSPYILSNIPEREFS